MFSPLHAPLTPSRPIGFLSLDPFSASTSSKPRPTLCVLPTKGERPAYTEYIPPNPRLCTMLAQITRELDVLDGNIPKGIAKFYLDTGDGVYTPGSRVEERTMSTGQGVEEWAMSTGQRVEERAMSMGQGVEQRAMIYTPGNVSVQRAHPRCGGVSASKRQSPETWQRRQRLSPPRALPAAAQTVLAEASKIAPSADNSPGGQLRPGTYVLPLYRRDVVTQPPQTWSQLLELLESVNGVDVWNTQAHGQGRHLGNRSPYSEP
eukprot:365204-Chlamydomonas_euryale.AAC.7